MSPIEKSASANARSGVAAGETMNFTFPDGTTRAYPKGTSAGTVWISARGRFACAVVAIIMPGR